MTEKIIAIIEHDISFYTALYEILESLGFKKESILHYRSTDAFLAAHPQNITSIFFNLSLTGTDSKRADSIIKTLYPHTPLIVLGTHETIDAITDSIKNYSDAFVLKDHLTQSSVHNAINFSTKGTGKKVSFVHSSIDYYHFFINSPCPMWVLESSTLKFLDANPAVANLYGYTRDEFLTLRLPDLRDIDENFKHTFSNRPLNTFYDAGITLHKKKNGEPIYVHIYSQTLKTDEINARLVFVIDSNAQMLAELENKELNNKIRKQKDRLEEILSSINDVVWSRDKDFTLSYINPACLKVFGYSPEEMIGKKIEYIYPADIDKLQKEVERTVANGQGKLEYRVIHKDGSVKSIITNAVAKKNSQGIIKYFTGVSVDVTEMRAMEQEITRYSKEIENILDSIRDGFFSLDQDWNFVYVNKAFAQIYQCDREDIIGTNYWEKFENARQQKFYSEYSRAFKDQIDVHFEEYASSLGKWVFVSVYPSKQGITVYFADITDEKQMKEQIIKDEYNLRSLINNTKDLIWSIDKEYHLISANEAYRNTIQAMTGIIIKPGDSVIMDSFDEKTKEKWLQYYAKVLNGESLTLTEENKDFNSVQYIEISFTPMYDNHNVIVGCCCMARNVTEQRSHQLQIEWQNKQLKEIAWIQSHQVRAPLATILGLIHLLNCDTALDCDNQRIIEGIKASAEELDNVVREIVNKTTF